MSTVAEIKAAIDRLSFEDRSELIALLTAPRDDDWNRQMPTDAAARQLDQLVEAAEKERKMKTAESLSRRYRGALSQLAK